MGVHIEGLKLPKEFGNYYGRYTLCISEDGVNILGFDGKLYRVTDEDTNIPRWIPVTERLPKDFEAVLCWYEYYHWSKEKILPEYGRGYVKNGRWCGEVANGKDCKVLAWLPLPEPPHVKKK